MVWCKVMLLWFRFGHDDDDANADGPLENKKDIPQYLVLGLNPVIAPAVEYVLTMYSRGLRGGHVKTCHDGAGSLSYLDSWTICPWLKMTQTGLFTSRNDRVGDRSAGLMLYKLLCTPSLFHRYIGRFSILSSTVHSIQGWS